jgi:hypothetical protein
MGLLHLVGVGTKNKYEDALFYFIMENIYDDVSNLI